MYDYPSVFAVKLLVRRGDSILLVREPEHNEWMPGRLGLPGGKPLEGEFITGTLERKIATEVGFEVKVTGIVKLVNIMMPEKTVYHLVVAADHVHGDIDTSKTESDDVAWYSSEQIQAMTKHDFTEYYNDKLIKGYLDGSLTEVPISFLQTQDNRYGEVALWMEQ